MIILKTRSDGKVTVNQKWYATLGHPKTHPQTKYEIPTSEYRSNADSRNYVKVTVTGKWNMTIRHCKMPSHSKFEFYTLNNKGDMLQILF